MRAQSSEIRNKSSILVVPYFLYKKDVNHHFCKKKPKVLGFKIVILYVLASIFIAYCDDT